MKTLNDWSIDWEGETLLFLQGEETVRIPKDDLIKSFQKLLAKKDGYGSADHSAKLLNKHEEGE